MKGTHYNVLTRTRLLFSHLGKCDGKTKTYELNAVKKLFLYDSRYLIYTFPVIICVKNLSDIFPHVKRNNIPNLYILLYRIPGCR